jgi:hypothetical protein
MQEVFTLSEAQALQGNLLLAIHDYRDEHNRVQIPQTGLCRVIGLDVWPAEEGEHTAGNAIQFLGHEQHGWPAKVVLVNKTTFHEHFEDHALMGQPT